MKKILLNIGKVFLLIFVTFSIWVFSIMGNMRAFIPDYFSLSGSLFSQKTYLVLLQNNAELRPTGGFISSFAELTFTNGFPTGLSVKDVFSLKGYNDAKIDKAPYPMEKFLAGDNYKGYSFHDANWSPDLPTSAKDILGFYKEEFPEKKIDGIITVNFSFFEKLVAEKGPINIKNKVIDGHNLFQTILFEQNNIDLHSTEDLSSRKSILSELLSETLKKSIFDVFHYNNLFNLVYESIQNKDIAFYSADPELEKNFATKLIGNTFPMPEQNVDPFIVVLGNLGGMKSDRYIERNFSHTVSIEPGTDTSKSLPIKVTTTLTFHHLGGYNAPLSHQYRGFIRTYIPLNATIDGDLRKDVEKTTDLGFAVLGESLFLDPGETKTLTYSYILPTTMLAGDEYKSIIYKQSGIENTSYHATFIAPIDHLVQSKTMEMRENVALFESDHLQNDIFIAAHIEKDITPPRITTQQFLDYNKLLIQFNEPVQKFDCEHTQNYTITDKDVTVKELTNTVRIAKITCKEREAIIQTTNIRTQFGEFFNVELRNIRDTSNNLISPNPMNITVPQRFPADDPANVKKK